MKPDFYSWEDARGKYKQVVAPYKRGILASYAVRYDLRTFVETGTCNGDCLLALHRLFDWCYSIELLDSQFDFTAAKFASMSLNITLLRGDSGKLLPEVLSLLRVPTLFWLDAHGDNWKGPIVEELQAIFATNVRGAILIDDMDYITDVLPTDPRWKEESREYGIVRLLHVA